MIRLLRPALLPVLVVGLAAGCGDDPVDPGAVDITDFVGVWTWNVGNINSTCGSETVWDAQVTISQVGGSATQVTASSRWRADTPGPFSFAGTVSGNTLTIPNVTYTEDSGTLLATHTVTLQNNGNLAGTETWTWTYTDPVTNETSTCANGTADILAIPAVP